MNKLIRNIADIHRWTGTLGCLAFLVWFMSGFAMIYVEMPYFRRTAEAHRYDRTLGNCSGCLSPEEAARRGKLKGKYRSVKLSVPDQRPVYEFQPLPGVPGTRTAIIRLDAQTGAKLKSPGPEAVLKSARRFAERIAPGRKPQLEEMLEMDQWTLYSSYFKAHRPLYRFRLDDEAGSIFYISSKTGGLVQLTSRNQRILAWLGPIPHWIYPTLLRSRPNLWVNVVIWLSAFCCLVAVSGNILGWIRFSRARKSGRITPFRKGSALRVHHILGMSFGLFATTWILSGLFSMNPGGWSPSTRPSLESAKVIKPEDFKIRPASYLRGEIVYAVEFQSFSGRPLYRLMQAQKKVKQLEAQNGKLQARAGYSKAAILASLGAASALRAESIEILNSPGDSYYYNIPGRKNNRRPFPVYRIRLKDAKPDLLYVNPATGKILIQHSSLSRLNRWLYHGLHSLDIHILMKYPLLRELILIILLLGGTGLSGSAVYAAYRLLRNKQLSLVRGPKSITGLGDQ